MDTCRGRQGILVTDMTPCRVLRVGGVGMRRSEPVVVTDMQEPLTAVHRRMIRVRLVLMGVWILGWVAAGLVVTGPLAGTGPHTGWVAILIVVLTGPALWALNRLRELHRRPGTRTPVSRRAISGPAAPGAGRGR